MHASYHRSLSQNVVYRTTKLFGYFDLLYSQSCNQYQPVLAAAYSQQPNTSYPLQHIQTRPQVFQDSKQASFHPTHPFPEPDGGGHTEADCLM